MAETSKKRTVRIPLDYFKRPDPLDHWKTLLTVVGVVIAAGWAFGLGWDFWSRSRRSERSRQLASHGPLARPHATWELQCETCHIPFQPIGQTTWTARLVGDSRQSDTRCKSCHAGSIHHTGQSPEDPACAGCHHDHQGRDASLVRISDQHCTQCHANLTRHMSEERTPRVAASVTRFDDNPDHHPAFRVNRAPDPGRLKFDHARHLKNGMALPSGGPIQTLAMMRESDRERYKSYAKGSDGFIQLDCAACHRLEPGDDGAAPWPGTARNAGAYMLPVSYARDCRACHSLDFDPAVPTLVMSHPIEPAEVHRSLWETYATRYLSANPALLDKPIPPRPLPGKPEAPEVLEARRVIDNKVQAAEKLLFGAKKCAECHDYETADGSPVPSLEMYDPKRDVRITPTNVPAVWFLGAVFDHSAHRAVSCRECHARANGDSADASHQSGDVLLPTVKECLECHSPRRAGAEARTRQGGASFDCTECHRYHNDDSPLQGRGAPSRDALGDATIKQFLLGAPEPGQR